MDFAFLIHSRDWTDVARKFKIAKYLPKSWVEFWCYHWRPIVVSKITGLKDKQGKECKGWLIGIPMTAKQMMENRKLAKTRIIQAIKKAEKLGAKIVGLGGLTSSVTKGGADIKDKVAIRITPGYAYTAFTVSSYALKVIEVFNLNKHQLTLGIVGAAGCVGSSCAQFLAEKGLKNFILIDLEKRNLRLQKIISRIHNINPKINIINSHQINDIKEADIIIAATNAPEAVIRPEDLKKGAIIIDDAQPSDISPEVAKQRDDIFVIDGGVVNTPNINTYFNLGVAMPKEIFCCLGEVLIAASGMSIPNYDVEEINISLIEKVGSFGKLLGLGLTEFQRFGKVYSSQKFKAINIQ